MGLKKVTCLIVGTVILLSSLVGCNNEPFTYEFRQARSNVEKVEICAFDFFEDSKKVLVQLNEADVDALLADIQSIPCSEPTFSYDGPNDYGDVVIFITYLDGEEEMIGLTNIGWRDPNGKHHYTSKFFQFPDIRDVIAKYVDAEVLAEFDGF